MNLQNIQIRNFDPTGGTSETEAPAILRKRTTGIFVHGSEKNTIMVVFEITSLSHDELVFIVEINEMGRVVYVLILHTAVMVSFTPVVNSGTTTS